MRFCGLILFGLIVFGFPAAYAADFDYGDGVDKIEQLKQKYSGDKIKVLIVPGHDKDFSGASFRGVSELRFNLELANSLYDFFKEDVHFDAYITQDKNGYLPVFRKYFSDKKQDIENYIESASRAFKETFSDFYWIDGVDHNKVDKEMALRLFGINMWADNNQVDLIIHVHFNDYGGRKANRVGEYSGFSIYIPEKQFSNNLLSAEFAQAVFANLKKLLPVSDLPKENAGIVEDQQLIAIGPKNSLSSSAMLIEYGYLYDTYGLYSSIRKSFFGELAYETYKGIKNYFEPDLAGLNSTLLPHHWTNSLVYGIKNSKDVLALQVALAEEGVYPPRGYTLKNCPITGNYLKCTKLAVSQFQEKYGEEILKPTGLKTPNGRAGYFTIKKMNNLFSN